MPGPGNGGSREWGPVPQYLTFIIAACSSGDATGLYILDRYLINTQSNLSYYNKYKAL